MREKMAKHSRELFQLPANATLRLKTQKSATRTCTRCGSGVAVRFLRSAACPVCDFKEFALTKADIERRGKLIAEGVALEEAIAAAKAEWSAAEIRKAGADPSKLQWFIGAWCSC